MIADIVIDSDNEVIGVRFRQGVLLEVLIMIFILNTSKIVVHTTQQIQVNLMVD